MDHIEYDHDVWIEDLIKRSSREYGYDGQKGAALTDWQEDSRLKLQEVLGFPAMGHDINDNDVKAYHHETLSKDGYKQQKWGVQTEPGFRVPFYLLLPDESDPPYPVVLTLHGHTDVNAGKELAVGNWTTASQRREIVEDKRDLAIQAVERGYAALAPDMRAFGELSDSRALDSGEKNGDERACTRMQKHAQLLGRTLSGERTWDILCLIDFVESHSPLDDDRIAITGHSGGGAVTLFAAALDPRLSVAAPNGYVCTFADSIIAMDHCNCNYVPGILRFGEMWDVAGLIAPRPLTVVTGAEDSIFPIEGVKRTFSAIQEIYRNAGAENGCKLHIGDGGHRYYPDEVWPFIETHL